jgi:hypothetical protein
MYYGQSLIPVKHMFYTALISVCCYLPGCILSVYIFLGALWPLLRLKRYVRFLFAFLLLAVFIMVMNFYTSMAFYYLTCECDMKSVKFLQIVGQGTLNGAHALTTGGLVLAIRMSKEWFLKERENRHLAKITIAQELLIEKARLYPQFLFQSLATLESGLHARSSASPEIIMRLSDLLSYLLYEGREEQVSLEKELSMINNLLMMERLNQGTHLEIETMIDVDPANKLIRPLIIFPVLQRCMEVIGRHDKEKFRMTLKLSTENNRVLVTVQVAQYAGVKKRIWWDDILKSVAERLNYFYNEITDLAIEENGDYDKIHFNVAYFEKAE